MLIRLIKWIWRSWPVLTILIVILIHYQIDKYFTEHSNSIFKLASLISQIVGGFLILLSIDSNIQTFNQNKISSIFFTYLRDFPLIKRNIVLQAKALSQANSFSTAKMSLARRPKNIDEQIEYLQEQIEELKKDIIETKMELKKEIDSYSNAFRKEVEETKSALGKLEFKIKDSSITGLKIQLFGVLLMLYGSFCGFLSQ